MSTKREKKFQPQKTYILRKKGSLNLYLSFLTTLHKTFTFHDYLLQFSLKKKLFELQVCLNLF